MGGGPRRRCGLRVLTLGRRIRAGLAGGLLGGFVLAVLFYFYDYDATPPTRNGVSMIPLLPTLGLEASLR